MFRAKIILVISFHICFLVLDEKILLSFFAGIDLSSTAYSLFHCFQVSYFNRGLNLFEIFLMIFLIEAFCDLVRALFRMAYWQR